MKSGPMIILIGPSGVGKSSFLDRAVLDFSRLRDTVTYTTRAMRTGEKEGQPYHFVSREQFQKLITQGFFVEHAEVHGQFYGTPLHQLEDAWGEKDVLIMDVDVQGAHTFKSKYPDSLTIFILPPNLDALRHRLIKRGRGEAPIDLDVRLRNAEIEMAQAPRFDHQVINDNFDVAYAEIKKLIEEYLRNR